MSIRINTVGKSSFKPVELGCMFCGYFEERTIDLRDCNSDEEVEAAMNAKVVCPSCHDYDMERLWMSAPHVGKLGKEGSDASVAAMKQSFNKRFVEKEADAVRHKFGSEYDDSIRGAEVARIKRDLGNK